MDNDRQEIFPGFDKDIDIVSHIDQKLLSLAEEANLHILRTNKELDRINEQTSVYSLARVIHDKIDYEYWPQPTKDVYDKLSKTYDFEEFKNRFLENE